MYNTIYSQSTSAKIRLVSQNPAVWILLSLFALSCGIRLYILCATPFAFGADGYYYAAQIRYYFEEGHFFSADSSLFLYFLTYFSLLGKDPVFTNKIAISLLSSLLIFPAYEIGKTLSNKKGGIICGVCILSNSLVSHFIFEYCKNLAGIFFFLYFLYQLLLTLINPERKGNYIGLCIFFILVFFTHKLMAALATILFLGYVGYRFKKRWVIITVAGSILLLFIGMSSLLFPNTLHVTDFSRLQSFFSFYPQWAPLSYIRTHNLTWLLSIEILLLALTPFLLVFSWNKITNAKKIFLVIMLGLYVLMVFPFFKFTGNDLAFRLFILLFIPSAIFIALHTSTYNKIMIAIIIFLLVPYQYYLLNIEKDSSQLDYDLYNDLLPLIDLPHNSLLIVHQGFDYFYCYNRKGDAFHFMPEKKHWDRPLYRLAYGVPAALLEAHYSKSSTLQFLPGTYTLLEEKAWQDFLKKIPAEKAAHYKTWRNPYIYRPAYMLRNEKFLDQSQ